MNNLPLHIVVPIFNEGRNILKLMENFQKHVKTPFRILLCYDDDNDDVFKFKKNFSKFNFEIHLIKNPAKGPCTAVIKGMNYPKSKCVIVYPADDFINHTILDRMYIEFVKGSDIVVASRFIKGGSMTGCPIIKSILVKLASNSLYFLSSIPVKDASNGFRLFSRKLINKVKIESEKGFAYSLELLVKCNRLKYKISEIPAIWVERCEGSSRFKIFKWLPQYLKWYFYGLGTTWLKKGPEKI